MITFTLWSSNGLIAVNIKGKEYTYEVDAAMIPEWRRKSIKTPGKVFNEIKRLGKLTTSKKETTTMAKATTIKNIITSAKNNGYTVEAKETTNKVGKIVFEIVKQECPDCKAVYTEWLKAQGKEPIEASYMTAITLLHSSKPSVVACQCGYRNSDGKVIHSKHWHDTFSSTTCPAQQPEKTSSDSKKKSVVKKATKTKSEKPKVETKKRKF